MKVASLFLCSFTAISGFAILSLPAVAAECWMTCPPGSASTPSAAEQQPPTAAAEPAALPDQQKPITKANVTDKSLRLRRHPQRRRHRRLQPKPPPSHHRIHRKRSRCPLKNPLQFKLRKLQRPRLRLLNPQRQPQHRGRMRTSQPPQPAAAFQPAPVQEAAPPPTPIPGPVPGTSTMRVIPE